MCLIDSIRDNAKRYNNNKCHNTHSYLNIKPLEWKLKWYTKNIIITFVAKKKYVYIYCIYDSADKSIMLIYHYLVVCVAKITHFHVLSCFFSSP